MSAAYATSNETLPASLISSEAHYLVKSPRRIEDWFVMFKLDFFSIENNYIAHIHLQKIIGY